jgi:uncharacterized protein YgbK (DUF1537 family)
MAPALPDGLLLAFYGDDFTGSSAVMEVLTFAGLPTVMFVAPPSETDLARFVGRRAIGIASVARAQSPAWMDENLPPAFEALAALNASVTHYKICSTLDSSPEIGSIGRAVDIGIPIFGRRPAAAAWQPFMVAAPPLRRYQAFGNLFAGLGEDTYRLDRHPVMRDHPVTPMHEADVRLHLAAQTGRGIGLVDFAAMKSGKGEAQFRDAVAANRTIVALDAIDDETLRWCGALMWENRGAGLFAIGSQGIEYALVEYWRAAGLLPPPAAEQGAAVEQIIAMSGSVSSVTAAQIDWAEQHGFDVILVDPAAVIHDGHSRAAIDAALALAQQTLSAGRSPLIVTARRPRDPSAARLRAAAANVQLGPAPLGRRIGEALGQIARQLVAAGGPRRLVVSGGDTSGFAVGAMGILALEALVPLAPGAPLCRTFSHEPAVDGLEIALKGGQMGGPAFFGSVRAGRAIS